MSWAILGPERGLARVTLKHIRAWMGKERELATEPRQHVSRSLPVSLGHTQLDQRDAHRPVRRFAYVSVSSSPVRGSRGRPKRQTARALSNPERPQFRAGRRNAMALCISIKQPPPLHQPEKCIGSYPIPVMPRAAWVPAYGMRLADTGSPYPAFRVVRSGWSH